MTNNEVLHSIQMVLGINELAIAEIFALANYPTEQTTITAFLKDIQEDGYAICDDNAMTAFLNGLITYRRGPSDQKNKQDVNPVLPLNNNIIFKKLRIAFDLKEDDLIELMSLANFDISKNELSAISRKYGHKHYRACSDEFLMALLVALTFRQWH